MAQNELLTPVSELVYLMECAALNYTGELKWGLAKLCESIQQRAPGYDPAEIQAALPELEQSLTRYRSGNNDEGVNLLVAVSRAWRQAIQTQTPH